MVVESVAIVVDRDESVPHPERLTSRYGCRTLAELVQRATRVSSRTAAEAVAAGKAVRRSVAPSTGELLPAQFPAMRAALTSGHAGLDGVAAVLGVFRGTLAGRDGLLAADEELAAAASGCGADGALPASADDLRAMAQVWAAYLDPDGSERAESRALRKRGVTIGRPGTDGLVPVRGGLLPEVAALLQVGFDSVLNPRVAGADLPGPRFVGADQDDPIGLFEEQADQRTAAQKRHDALATLLTAAIEADTVPTLGGTAATLVVQVREEDLATGRGYAHVDGEPVPIASARHIACSGAVQRVLTGENGRILSLTTLDRVFTHHQRKAIGLRDGGCVIPGCHVTARWCEIHHVQEHARGGPTHVDNGVLLCFFHHRTIDTSGWRIRMIDGVPHVKGPYWWDSDARWRPVMKSPTRRRELIVRRT
ncbi:HNH endonuclease signature motif containing protein [Microbacterium jejuense]|uniref:HNH endonuclease signature motif containing protein n=1 Tax=Microbacterium jejuense TaxID=1263637 RepID=UPI0031EC8651